MAATNNRLGSSVVLCLVFVYVVNSTSDNLGLLSRLYSKASENNRPLVLVLNSVDQLKNKLGDREVSVDVKDRESSLPYVHKLDEASREDYHKNRRPRHDRYRSRLNKNRDYDRRDRSRYDEDSRVSSYNKHKPNDRYEDRSIEYFISKYLSKHPSLLSRYRDYGRNDRYRDERDRKYKSYKSRDTRLRTEDKNQVSVPVQEANLVKVVQDVLNDKDKNRQEQDRKEREREVKPSPKVAEKDSVSAQIPVLKSLLRSLNCNARDECEDSCNSKYSGNKRDQCEDTCEQKFECEEEEEYEDPCDDCNNDDGCGQNKCTGSTRGERLVTEKPACKRC